MKKALLTCSVSLAVLCCTLVYAATGVVSRGKSAVADKPTNGMQIDPTSIHRATSRIADDKGIDKAKAESSRLGEDEVVVDLWNTAHDIYAFNDGGVYDAESNTLIIPGNSENSEQIFTAVDEECCFEWYAVGGQTYHFSGTLNSDGDVTVAACIAVQENGPMLVNSIEINLNASNDYTYNFDLTASDIPDGRPLLVAFLLIDNSSEITVTSTNNQFYYSYPNCVAEEWNSETGMPNLGLENFGWGTYTYTTKDGATTLGLYYDGTLYVTGINTTASEVELPSMISIDGQPRPISYFGHYDQDINWEGAENLKSLDISSARQICTSFYNTNLSDLYIGSSSYFENYPYGVENIYLHIPYEANKSNYNSYGFKRVLVGEELPEYPEGSNSKWVIPGKSAGNYFGISIRDGYYTVSEIFTDKESVELPSATPGPDGQYWIRGLGNDNNSYSSYLCQDATELKSVIIPDNYRYIKVSWSNTPINELHMLGDVPESYWSIPSGMTVYVANKSYYANYESNSTWSKASILPDGWEFDWLTVNVGRKGEFAQTYIEMTDADWSLGRYVKITGTLNSTDLNNIKNLTNLRKLDLSEAEFGSLPSQFLSSKTTIEEVILPETVNTIPERAFYYCNSLTKVTAPGVYVIDNSAFANCSSLTDFDLSKVQIINSDAFNYCSRFNPTDLSSVTYLGSSALSRTAIKEVVIPEGITEISSNLFNNCQQLTSVTLPSTITSIGSYAFNQCGVLTTVNLPEGITSIGSNAFNSCSLLTEITLPSTLETVGSGMFSGCRSLVDIKCKAIVPPVASSNFTGNMDLNHCTLYVAPFAIDAYRSAANWRAFYIMKPLDEPVKNIYINRPMTFDLLSEDNAVLQENPNMTLDYTNSTVGQLSAYGDGTLSAGMFKIFHSFARRDYRYDPDYRTTLVNEAENMRADNVMCSIEFEKDCWHFISFQYDVKMEDIFGLNGTDFAIRQYNGEKRASGEGNTSNWEDVPADGTLLAGKGYIIQAANNSTNVNGNANAAIVRFPSRNTTTKNNLFTNKNVIVPLEKYEAEFAHNRSWNLVGNPYPCYYDMHALMDDFTTPITLWRGSSYQAYSPVDDDIILRPNEAFFVQRPLDAEQMTFGAEGRMHYNKAVNANATPGVRYAPAMKTGASARSVFNFTVEGCGSNDRARIVMNEEASMDYEINCDASKFLAETATGAELYVDDKVLYSICERPFDNGEALLGLRVAQDGEYTISMEGRNTEGWSVMLTDNVTDATVDITATPYEFHSEAGDFRGRFTVRFQRLETNIDNVQVDGTADDVQVIDIAGIVVFNGRLDDFKAAAQPGVYVVVSKGKATKIVVK